MTEEEKQARLQALLAEQARRQQAAPAAAPQAAPAAAPSASVAPPPQRDIGAVVSALVANGGMDTDQNRAVNFAFELQDRDREAQERARREQERLAEEAQSEGVADLALGLALNPEADPDNRAALLTDPALANMSANDRLNALIRTGEIFDGPLADVVNPEVEPDAISRSAAEAYRARESARIENSLQARLLEQAQEFQGDPVNALIRDLEIGRDGETRDDFDRLDLERRIEAISTEYGIPPERVAVAMHQNFIRDPDNDWVPFFDMTRNTIENRFPEDKVRDFIETNLSPEAIDAHYNRVRSNQENSRRLGQLETELTDLRVTAERYRQIGQEIPPELEVAIADTQSRIRTFGQLPPEPEPEPERDPNPSAEVSDDRIREAIIFGNNYFTQAGIMPHVIHMRQNPDQRAATLERIQAHIQNDQNLTADQKNILWAVANQ
jgi:hypothetical protein